MKRTLLFGHDQTVADFVSRLAPIERPAFAPGFRGVGVLRTDGALIAGVVFSSWRSNFGAWDLSVAGVCSYLFSTEVVNQLKWFAFRQLSANRIEARTAVDNKRARALLKAFGFTEEGVSADYYGPRCHAVTARLLKSEWERSQRITEIRKAA
jgi:RimJ/RimL family protein N-acetyltransferase